MTSKIHDLLKQRFSARNYNGVRIPEADLISLFEAARWAPSSYNDQPWAFILARREDAEGFERMLSCTGGNRPWCEGAGALLACVTMKNLRRGKPNPHGRHDLGLAIMAMAVQGVSLGLQMREMAGVEREKMAALYKVPDTHDIVSGLAIGYTDEKAENLGRERQPLKDFVFEGSWGKKPGFL
jgi:nitroreductase